MSETKICSKCINEYPATTEYFRFIKKDNKFKTSCKACDSIRNRQWREEHPDYMKGYYRDNFIKENGYINKRAQKDKICNICNISFPNTDEYFYKGQGKCKTCSNKIASERNKNNEQYIQYQKEYRKDNEENRKKYLIINKDILSEKAKQYRKVNRDKLLERSRKYHEENKERLNKESLDYYYSNKEKFQQYRITHRREINILKQRREARKRELSSTLTANQWRNIMRDFDNKCAYCEEKLSLSQEHFIPLSKGGEYTHNNIIPACIHCNSSKGDKSFFEWYPKFKHHNKQREEKILQYLNYHKHSKTQQFTFF